MVSRNPFATFQAECRESLEDALKKVLPNTKVASLSLEEPPSPDFGQQASSLCFELARRIGEKPVVLAKRLVDNFDKKKFSLIEQIIPAGSGYINFHVDFAEFSGLTIDSARHFDKEYGLTKTDNPLEIIVEHTSANPLSPIHIGQARNPILGDTIARILKGRGHNVYCHYYVDDVGRQSAVVAYGYEKLGKPKPDVKPDHFIGRIYAVTSCLVEISKLKRELKYAKEISSYEEIKKINRELDDWMAVAVELEDKNPHLFELLLDEINEDQDPGEMINELNRAYEAEDEHVKQIIREVSEMCLEGFRETLSQAGVFYDSWDWESETVWSSRVQNVLEKLKRTPYVLSLEGVLKFDAEKAARELGMKKRLGLRESYEIPSLTLVRADGTTLYPTRDIAYSLWKFEKAEKVINVIGMDQKLPQLQLRIALRALGYSSYAENLVHFAYNLVNLPDYKMSGRRGRYITFDEAMNEAIKRAYEEVSKRSPQLPEKEKKKIADFVGKGAVRYALVEVDPYKPVVFTWDRVLNFETNSAPYIQYSHARACSILRKADRRPEQPAYNLLKEELEHEIVMMLASFPKVFTDAAELLNPNSIADYSNRLADKFNSFYNALAVIKAKPQELSDARLALVEAVIVVLRNALNLLGIVAPERM